MSIYTEVVLEKVNGKFVITESGDNITSRVDYENAAKEDGLEIARLDGDLPKWARPAAAGFFDNLDVGDLRLDYAYAQRTNDGAILIGLVRN